MSNYIVRQGETITDAILNATGDISFLDEVLTLNSLSDWNPELTIGQVLLIPDIAFDLEIISDLNLYPANNYSVYGLLDLMNTILLILQENSIINTELPAAYPVPDLSTYYIILQGDSITDAILNLSGNLKFWDSFLNENKIADWTPNLLVGQKIKLPTGTLIDQNTTRQLAIYPASNGIYDNGAEITKIEDQISSAVGTLPNLWILATGYWNDQGIWIDTSLWID